MGKHLKRQLHHLSMVEFYPWLLVWDQLVITVSDQKQIQFPQPIGSKGEMTWCCTVVHWEGAMKGAVLDKAINIFLYLLFFSIHHDKLLGYTRKKTHTCAHAHTHTHIYSPTHTRNASNQVQFWVK